MSGLQAIVSENFQLGGEAEGAIEMRLSTDARTGVIAEAPFLWALCPPPKTILEDGDRTKAAKNEVRTTVTTRRARTIR
jgi:hypothetical protein